MPDVKFCKDCRFYQSVGGDWQTARCNAPGRKQNLVIGGALYSLCESQRDNIIGDCGPNATLFQPKEPEQVAA